MKGIEKTMEVPEGITVQIEEGMIKVKGKEGEVSRKLPPKSVSIEVKEKNIVLSPVKRQSKREKAYINTSVSHLKNMFAGVEQPFVYKLKICSSHFLMKVSLKDGTLEVSNFIGEKISRVLKLKDAKVDIDGEIITVSSPDKELAGQVAADIEKLMKRPNFDKRVFMDGIYLIEKAGVILK